MLSTIMSAAVFGMDCYPVEVEVCVSDGLPGFDMVGSLNCEVREARERVRVTLQNMGISIPPSRITVNLSPADRRKEGTAFDFPIAVALLSAIGIISEERTKGTLFVGELGLSGELKFVRGTLPILLMAREQGFQRCAVPSCNAKEASSVWGMQIYGFSSLAEACGFYNGKENVPETEGISESRLIAELNKPEERNDDFADVNGQAAGRRAAEIAAAGFHNLLLTGPPGSGKTMIAKRIPGILPPMSKEECLSVSKVYSVAGLLNEKQALVRSRPYLSPHHTISEQAFAGGGRIPRPGVISLAHRGVLFLDEFPEFKRPVLEILREPLEEGKIRIARNSGMFCYPADFMLVAAMNLCPCGHYPDRDRCRCRDTDIIRYAAKISAPLLDRIDLCVRTEPVRWGDLQMHRKQEGSNELRQRVLAARAIQAKRYRGKDYCFNSRIRPSDVGRFCMLGEKEKGYLEKIYQRLHLSARGYYRLLKVARTIADLEGSRNIGTEHLAEASCYRMADSGTTE